MYIVYVVNRSNDLINSLVSSDFWRKVIKTTTDFLVSVYYFLTVLVSIMVVPIIN